MDEQVLASHVDAIHGLALDAFTAERDRRVKALRAEGYKQEAAALKQHRKPTVPAWAVDQLVRAAPDEVEHLLDAAEELRSAQHRAASGRGAQGLREANRRVRELVGELRERAAELLAAAGTRPDAHLDEVEQTLFAAAVDPERHDLLRRGIFSTVLPGPGFDGLGFGGLGFGLAALPDPPAPDTDTDADTDAGADADEAVGDVTARDRDEAGVRDPLEETADGLADAAEAAAAAQAVADAAEDARRAAAKRERELEEDRTAEEQQRREEAARREEEEARSVAAEAQRRQDEARRVEEERRRAEDAARAADDEARQAARRRRLQRRIDAFEVALDQQRDRVQRAQERADELRTQAEAAHAEVEAARTDLADYEDDLAAARRELDELTASDERS